MPTIDEQIRRHYQSGDLLARILSGLEQSGKSLSSIEIGDLAPTDEFHTRGLAYSVELAALANILTSDLVLDVGCGIGGTARYLAKQFGCHVTGIDITEEYISVGRALNELVGLGERIELHCGSALDLPFEDDRFNIVWTDHVQMNIADKENLYSEIARVLKPGGCLLFHDIFQGDGGPLYYPTPWAEDESISALSTEAQVRSVMEGVGLIADHWISKVPESIVFFNKVAARIDARGYFPLGIHLLMGENTPEKIRNLARSLSENRATVSIGLARRQ